MNHLPSILRAFANVTVPVVLSPGERWQLGATHDPNPAVEPYETEWRDRLEAPQLVRACAVDSPALSATAESFRHRGCERNWRWRIERLEPFRAFLEDLGRAAAFSYRRGFEPSETPREQCDIALTSDFLKYAFDFDWGFYTLSVSGCFDKPVGGRFGRLEEYQWVARLNNHGRRLDDPVGRLVGYLRERFA
jgi:hypothetical protein